MIAKHLLFLSSFNIFSFSHFNLSSLSSFNLFSLLPFSSSKSFSLYIPFFILYLYTIYLILLSNIFIKLFSLFFCSSLFSFISLNIPPKCKLSLFSFIYITDSVNFFSFSSSLNKSPSF